MGKSLIDYFAVHCSTKDIKRPIIAHFLRIKSVFSWSWKCFHQQLWISVSGIAHGTRSLIRRFLCLRKIPSPFFHVFSCPLALKLQKQQSPSLYRAIIWLFIQTTNIKNSFFWSECDQSISARAEQNVERKTGQEEKSFCDGNERKVWT